MLCNVCDDHCYLVKLLNSLSVCTSDNYTPQDYSTLTFSAGRCNPRSIGRELHRVDVRYMATILLYALIVPDVPEPHARIVTARYQIIAKRMKIDGLDALHVPIKRRVLIAVVQVPLFDDAILIS